MRNQIHIRRFIAGMLLGVFSLAIMPKLFVHNAVTRHVHTTSKTGTKTLQVSVPAIHCNCDDLVVTSLFTQTHADPGITIQGIYKPFLKRVQYFHADPAHIFFSLRGPPAPSV